MVVEPASVVSRQHKRTSDTGLSMASTKLSDVVSSVHTKRAKQCGSGLQMLHGDGGGIGGAGRAGDGENGMGGGDGGTDGGGGGSVGIP